MTTPLIPATLTIENETPVSDTYGDVYYSKEDGIAESRYVFLESNRLVERFAQTQTSFTIAETGFGTGLNCLLTMQLWLAHAPKHATLHYISIEKHPFAAKDLQTLYASHPLVEEASLLLERYPLLTPGAHQLTICSGRVQLTLLFADVSDALMQIAPHSIDAWFLDGFAPAKNPDMWQHANMLRVAETTAQGGSLATFTSVGAVRRSLMEGGLSMRKQKGFGHKRDMLVGQKESVTSSASRSPHSVLVIGAGIAGASAAYACAMQGMKVTVLDRHDAPAQEASGNPAGILYPYMARKWDAATEFYLQGFAHTIRLLKTLNVRHALCGMQHVPKDGDLARLQSLADTLSLPPDILHATDAGFAMPQSGWVDVPHFCERLLAHDAITIVTGQNVTRIAQDQCWEVNTHTQTYQVDALIIANARDAQALLPKHHVPMRHIRGQITYVPEHDMTKPLDQVLCYGGYITPPIDGICYLGATFDKERDDLTVDAEGHQQNLTVLRNAFPNVLKDNVDSQTLEGRAALRTVSGDRMPIVGQLYDLAMHDDLNVMPYSRHAADNMTIKHLPNVYLSLAHGARGTVSAPLAGAMITAHMSGAYQLESKAVSDLLNPARFTLRAWRKGI